MRYRADMAAPSTTPGTTTQPSAVPSGAPAQELAGRPSDAAVPRASPAEAVEPTLMFSDIEGSTRLWETRADEMTAALACHDAIAADCVRREGGRVVKTTGDGVHAAFTSPDAAVRAALALQQALTDPAATGGLVLKVRCGLHVGPAQARDGDFYGPAVNRAARIMSAAHGGQTLLSQALASRVASSLPAHAALRDLGRVQLRDLSSPERVFQLLHPALRDTFPPLRSLEATPNNLTQQLNSFVGRERELAEAAAKLSAARMLTLLGMGGIGKSRLSAQMGAALLDDFPDGVWFVELAPLTDPRLVAQAVASTLGLKEDAGQTVHAALVKYLRDKRVLLILDNCEHVVSACAELAKLLLQSAAELKLLVSSRTALQIGAEVTFQVPTLGVPQARADAAAAPARSPEALMRHESVRLFVDRAVAAQPGFNLTAGNAAAVSRICRTLDGIPLAIELAAARTRALTVQAIAERLDDRFKLLTTRDETVLPRQRTLRALVDWSHDLLSDAQRVLFRRLAVFAGGWTLEAAEQVGADALLPQDDVLDLLSSLVDASLVLIDVGAARYRMLDTVRAYALERLAQAGDDEAPAHSRHLTYFLELAEAARPKLVGPEQADWLVRLDQERENLLSAHHWSEVHPAAGDMGLRMSLALRPYWVHRGLLSLGLDFAVRVLERKGLQARSDARCRALGVAGQMCNYVGRYGEAKAYLEEGLDIARELDNARWAVVALRQLGMACMGLGLTDAASVSMAESVALARSLGDTYESGAALTALAALYRTQSRLAEAAPLYREALTLAREMGNSLSVAATLLNLAMVSIDGSLDAPPQPMLLEALDIAEQAESPPLLQSVCDVCAGLAAERGQWPAAGRYFGAAEQLSRLTGLQRDAADESFLAPRLVLTRQVLGDAGFASAHDAGAALAQAELGAELRAWLGGAA